MFFLDASRRFGEDNCVNAMYGKNIEEIYNLQCLMGGMGYIGQREHDYDIMVGSSLMLANVIECAVTFGVKKIFYSSSACVYNMLKQSRLDSAPLTEQDIFPAYPDLTYGWQKIFGEMLHQSAMTKGIEIRIARFHNVHGTHGHFDGGKEKVIGALCRKVALAKDGDEIEVWGDGEQLRSFMYIDDCIEGIIRLMDSDFNQPLNLGSDEVISINELAQVIIAISGKKLSIKNVEGIQGVRARNSDNTLCKKVLNWSPKISLREGLEKTYRWVDTEIHKP